MEKEIWKDIKDYEGVYQVSDKGRVMRSSSGRIMKLNKRSYYSVNLCKHGVSKFLRIHQLVAVAFLGHVRTGSTKGLVVDHIDGDRYNNNLNNLQVITNRENTSKNRSGGTSKYVGVSWAKTKGKWKAEIVDGKKVRLGHFINEIDAHNAYQNYLKKII